ncbi:MAG: long-chain fatty acid--CoA ligase [Gemmatimonadetes bacterium]|nr:long-chain fatty acid--CoA ligase [Gemmatimonadota bacterium]
MVFGRFRRRKAASAPPPPDLPLLARARAGPDADAQIAPEGTFTFGALLTSSAGVARALLAGRADLTEARVAILVPSGFSWTAAVVGVWRAGGMAVPLPVAAPEAELERTLVDAAPEVVIVDPELVDRVAAAAARLGIPVRATDDVLPPPAAYDPAGERGLPVVPADRGALMLYTSGTTGRPKGVVHTHASLTAQVEMLTQAWRWSERDHVLLLLPLHHVHGIVNVVLCALAAGARCSILPHFDAVETWKRLAHDRLTVLMAVPTIYTKLIAEYDRTAEAVRDRWRVGAAELRLCVSGSAALPVSVHERWQAITGQRLLERYGMTEIGMALSNPLLGARVPGHVGAPLPSVETRVVADGGTLAPSGTQGELQVRGPALFREYWRRPDETTAAFTDDCWFRTGDEVVETERGFRILGRQSVDILKSGGEKISAIEIEEMLRAHPDLADCAVVGIPDAEWGERVCAAVVAAPGRALDPAALRAWAAERLSPWKVPREIRVVDALPVNALGKVVKPELRRVFE